MVDKSLLKSWFNEGKNLGKLGKYEDAIKCFDEAIKIDPNYALAWYSKGTVLENLRRYKEAKICYNKVNRTMSSNMKKEFSL
jgi:tetratricopeptide (TPR) repeat protein